MNFTKLFVGTLALSAMLAACVDDSTSAKDTEIEELSSSSAVEIPSSSSTIRNDSLSSSVIASSSSEAPQSSSSETPQSSSSETPQSSSSADVNSSSSENELSSSSEMGIIYGTMTDSRDDKTYKTVKIGEQVWMAENLNYASDSMSWCYDNDPANCAKYGRLYTWAAAMDSVKLATDADNPLDCGDGKVCGLAGKVQGVCPEGWHLPSYDEWNTLFTAVGGQSTAGKVLKSQTGWDESGNGTDAFGFSALPAGYRNYTGGYGFEGQDAFFWSSTEDPSSVANGMDLYFFDDYAVQGNGSKYTGRSVRCLKD